MSELARWANAHKLQANRLDVASARVRIGTITSYDPTHGTVRVLIQPEGVLSGWLPLGCMGIGKNAVVAGPNIGDQVLLEPHEGDAEHLIVTHRLFSTVTMPPTSPGTSAPVQSGEVAIFSGSLFIHLAGDGNIYSAGNWIHVGNFTVKGNTYTTESAYVTDDFYQGWNTSNVTQFGTHEHPQGADSHGDTEQNTGPPISGS